MYCFLQLGSREQQSWQTSSLVTTEGESHALWEHSENLTNQVKLDNVLTGCVVDLSQLNPPNSRPASCNSMLQHSHTHRAVYFQYCGFLTPALFYIQTKESKYTHTHRLRSTFGTDTVQQFVLGEQIVLHPTTSG